MKRIIFLGAIALMLIAAPTSAFTPSEKKVVSSLRTRITTLEAKVSSLESQVVTLESRLAEAEATIAELSEPPFAITNIIGTTGPTCDPTCYIDISWDVAPCATGQIEWGPTTDYGNLTKREDRLLCHHKQRISGLDPDSVYHYRIIATDGKGLSTSAVIG